MTLKQKLATEKLVENGGNIGKAMIEAGYSPMTAKTPQKLTESKGFQELKEQYKQELMVLGIDGKRLAKKMNEWLEAQRIFSSHTEADKLVPDYQTQLKAGEMIREDLGIKSETPIQILNQGDMEIEFFTDHE